MFEESRQRAFETMLDALTLRSEAVEEESAASQNQYRYAGDSIWMPHGRIFGGQVLAQSLLAAMDTIPEGRFVHSMHAYFLRAGEAKLPVHFNVQKLHDGRSFSTSRTEALQHGLPILSMIASFQTQDAGLDHQVSMPQGIPEPEDLPSDFDVLSQVNHPVAQYWASSRPFDMRHIDSDIYLTVNGETTAKQALWFRAIDRLPDDQNLHRAILAYVSDYTIMEPILRRHGVSWATEGMRNASLDHAMWWHRFARVDDWLLYVQESPTAQGGRGLALGRIFNRDGCLIASVAQEGMIRIPSIPS